MQRLSHISMRLRLAAAMILMLITVCALLALTSVRLTKQTMLNDAQVRQDISLRVIAAVFQNEFDGLDVTYSPDGQIRRARWADIPTFESHDLIDQIGRVSGETATLFLWDPAENDYRRITTNIIKPDGERAVGTYLGRENPVYAAVRRGETYRGEAVILGKPYLTIYQPVFGAGNDVIGILYVGVARTVIDAAIRNQQKTMLLTSAAFTVLGAIIVLLLSTRLMRPIADVSAAIARIAGGDLTTDVPHDGKSDEIGEIATRVTMFKADLQRNHVLETESRRAQAEQGKVMELLRHGLSRLADRDLTYRIRSPLDDPFPQTYEALREDFNAVVESLAATMAEIDSIAEEVTSAATGIASMSDALARRVENQAATLAQSSSTLHSLSETGKVIADKAENADDMAQKSLNLSTQSRQVLDDATHAIQEIEESSGQINQIIAVIEDIAFQTNLLALNAGVEAARAGEAGRGFAVVASEVRGLSMRATESAREIRTLITASRAKISEGTVLVQNTGTSLGQVLAQVEQMGTLIQDIALSVKEQAKGQSEVSAGVQQLDNLTQENAAMGEEAHAASDTLKSEAIRLTTTLQQFRTTDKQYAATRAA
ncbi:methyl-accepting chemotaxis protein [Yoonia sp.]|uniref:methyl-accepting chemotaxis protein n=1 Tax=Yoonia sp. TaxID=2212373 RepID=UPI0019F6F09B|nr:methyl-accepting chemotaxis protein [Yoonia sp.]MBE0412120.1 methyl-accepting chemotaxis protein [Yoonia sp.]